METHRTQTGSMQLSYFAATGTLCWTQQASHTEDEAEAFRGRREKQEEVTEHYRLAREMLFLYYFN